MQTNSYFVFLFPMHNKLLNIITQKNNVTNQTMIATRNQRYSPPYRWVYPTGGSWDMQKFIEYWGGVWVGVGWGGGFCRLYNKAVLFNQCSMSYTAWIMRLSAAACVYISGLASGDLPLYSAGGRSLQTLCAHPTSKLRKKPQPRKHDC